MRTRPRVPWLERQSTNRDTIAVSILFTALTIILGLTLPFRVWLEIVAGVALLVAGVIIGWKRAPVGVDPNAERYAEQASGALGTLQKVMLGTIAPVSIRDFVQEGLFEPAHAILANDIRGDVRFSVLVPDGEEFVMRHALGHDVESRREFRLQIHKSFAGLAFNEREIKWSDDTKSDSRFTPHPKARPGREYESIVAAPLWEGNDVFGVLVVVAEKGSAFTRADRIYIQELAAIMDVARAVGAMRRSADEDD